MTNEEIKIGKDQPGTVPNININSPTCNNPERIGTIMHQNIQRQPVNITDKSAYNTPNIQLKPPNNMRDDQEGLSQMNTAAWSKSTKCQ